MKLSSRPNSDLHARLEKDDFQTEPSIEEVSSLFPKALTVEKVQQQLAYFVRQHKAELKHQRDSLTVLFERAGFDPESLSPLFDIAREVIGEIEYDLERYDVVFNLTQSGEQPGHWLVEWSVENAEILFDEFKMFAFRLDYVYHFLYELATHADDQVKLHSKLIEAQKRLVTLEAKLEASTQAQLLVSESDVVGQTQAAKSVRSSKEGIESTQGRIVTLGLRATEAKQLVEKKLRSIRLDGLPMKVKRSTGEDFEDIGSRAQEELRDILFQTEKRVIEVYEPQLEDEQPESELVESVLPKSRSRLKLALAGAGLFAALGVAALEIRDRVSGASEDKGPRVLLMDYEQVRLGDIKKELLSHPFLKEFMSMRAQYDIEQADSLKALEKVLINLSVEIGDQVREQGLKGLPDDYEPVALTIEADTFSELGDATKVVIRPSQEIETHFKQRFGPKTKVRIASDISSYVGGSPSMPPESIKTIYADYCSEDSVAVVYVLVPMPLVGAMYFHFDFDFNRFAKERCDESLMKDLFERQKVLDHPLFQRFAGADVRERLLKLPESKFNGEVAKALDLILKSPALRSTISQSLDSSENRFVLERVGPVSGDYPASYRARHLNPPELIKLVSVGPQVIALKKLFGFDSKYGLGVRLTDGREFYSLDPSSIYLQKEQLCDEGLSVSFRITFPFLQSEVTLSYEVEMNHSDLASKHGVNCLF